MILSYVATLFHPGHDPNNHPAVFAEYAASGSWKAVHFAQFGAGLISIAGFIVLYRVLLGNQVDTIARFAVSGAIALVPSLAILQAIDGVALKEAVDAWAHAPSSEKAIAFKSAELVRWMEWGANSFFRLLQGVTVLLFGLALARSGIVSRVLGWFAIGAGLAYLAVGVIVGYYGFSVPSLSIGVTGDTLLFVAAAGVASAGWRRERRRS